MLACRPLNAMIQTLNIAKPEPEVQVAWKQEMDLVLDPVGGGLRLAYYPQSEALVEGQMGYGAHIDSGGVTWHNATLKDFGRIRVQWYKNDWKKLYSFNDVMLTSRMFKRIWFFFGGRFGVLLQAKYVSWLVRFMMIPFIL